MRRFAVPFVGFVGFVGFLTALGCDRLDRSPPGPAAGKPPRAAAPRDFDRAAAEEITAAWKRNPVAAEDAYAGVVFRVPAKVVSVDRGGCEIVSEWIPVRAPFTFDDPADAKKVTVGGHHSLLVSFTDYRPAHRSIAGRVRAVD